MSQTSIAIGCSTDSEYCFPLIFSALLWREHIGHLPLLFLVGTEDEWRSNKRLAVALAALDEHQVSRIWLGRLRGYPDATLAQNSRQHAAAVFDGRYQISSDAWLVPADADIWPLRREFYQAHVDGKHLTCVYFWNGDHWTSKASVLGKVTAGQRFQTIPTCHVAMRAKTWRDVYGLTPGESITEAVERTLGRWFERFPRNDFNVWMSDQDIMTHHLCSQPWFPTGRPPEDGNAHVNGEVLFVGRSGHPPRDRLDRAHPRDWERPFAPTQWTDAHVHKTPASLEHWAQLLPIIEFVLPKYTSWARKYHQDYLEATL